MAFFEKPIRETTTLDQVMAADPDSADEDDLIRKFLEEPVAETPPSAAPVVKAAPEVTTIKPIKGEDITVFSERAGYENLEEFMQNPANKENIRTTDSGIPYVLEGMDYQVKPGVVTEGIEVAGDTLTIEGETGTVLGGEPEIEGEEPGDETDFTDRDFEDISDVGTEQIAGGPDLGAEKAIAKEIPGPDLDAGKVTEKELATTTLPPEKPLLTSGEEMTPEYIMRIASETFKPDDPKVKSAWDDYTAEISKIKFNDESELTRLLEKQQKELTDEIASYQTKIDAVAKEEFQPKLKGWNKFMAVLGAAMGAYGSAMTGTPNFALNIMNEAMDRDAQEFANSKEMRAKNLEQQRLLLRERRGQLLTMAERAVDRIQQNTQFKLTAAASQASIKQTAEQIKNAKEENFRNYLGDLAAILVGKANTTATLDRALTKDERERRVEGIQLLNEDSEKVETTPFFAKTKEQQIKLTKFMEDTKYISDEIQVMKKLLNNPNIWVPAVFNETKAKMDIAHNNILLRVKFINNMGANFTESEQAMIKGVIPTTDIKGRLSVALVAIAEMDRKLLDGVQNVMKRHGAIPISMESLYSAKTKKSQKIPTITKISDMGK